MALSVGAAARTVPTENGLHFLFMGDIARRRFYVRMHVRQRPRKHIMEDIAGCSVRCMANAMNPTAVQWKYADAMMKTCFSVHYKSEK